MGNGVPQDAQQAQKLALKATKKNNPKSQAMLALLYAQDSSALADPAEAVKWFRKSVEAGNAIGQYGLGFMYEKGNGVKQDAEVAVPQYRLAAENGLTQGAGKAWPNLRTW